ncbi:hypothetical protein BaRGS_00040210 [Batillaria attramentaria]|uniref:Uncharacterized protein n=1 Tax=Batillaria attramentaria TaxID=370345 RepID=A0ABD0J1M4_9CAEN
MLVIHEVIHWQTDLSAIYMQCPHNSYVYTLHVTSTTKPSTLLTSCMKPQLRSSPDIEATEPCDSLRILGVDLGYLQDSTKHRGSPIAHRMQSPVSPVSSMHASVCCLIVDVFGRWHGKVRTVSVFLDHFEITNHSQNCIGIFG